MKNIVKNFNILGLLAFIAAGILAISWTEAKQNATASLFYTVTLKPGGQIENLEDYEIHPNGTSAPVGDCSENNGTLCAIEMDLGVNDAVPANLAEAELAGLVKTSVYRTSSN